MKNFTKGKKTIIRDSIANEFGISLSQQARIHGVSRNMMSLIHRNKRSDNSKSVEVLSAFALANQKVTNDSIREFKRSFENSFIEHKKKWIKKKLDDLDFKRQGLEKKRDRLQLKYDVLCAQLLRCEAIDTSTISNARKGESLKKRLATKNFDVRNTLSKMRQNDFLELELKLEMVYYEIQYLNQQLQK